MNDGGRKSFIRIVMVEFYPHITEVDIHSFTNSLECLAASAKGLLRMRCGSSRASGSEDTLNATAPNVTFAHFASVWEFSSWISLDEFIGDALHREMARKQFSKLVKHRYVINID